MHQALNKLSPGPAFPSWNTAAQKWITKIDTEQPEILITIKSMNGILEKKKHGKHSLRLILIVNIFSIQIAIVSLLVVRGHVIVGCGACTTEVR